MRVRPDPAGRAEDLEQRALEVDVGLGAVGLGRAEQAGADREAAALAR